jgi:hypothetical protein
MREINKAYSVIVELDAAAGVSGSVQFDIGNRLRAFKLKSILWELRIRETVSRMVLPYNQNITQELQLGFAALPFGVTFCQFAGAPTPAGTMPNNGNAIVLFEPGQKFFNSFVINEGLHVNFAYANNDLLLSYHYLSCIIIEIEDFDNNNQA